MGLFRRKQPYVPTGRVGWIQGFITGRWRNNLTGRASEDRDYHYQARVEEIGVVGDSSRVRVLEVGGLSNPEIRDAIWRGIDGTLFPTKKIAWEGQPEPQRRYRELTHEEREREHSFSDYFQFTVERRMDRDLALALEERIAVLVSDEIMAWGGYSHRPDVEVSLKVIDRT